MDDLLRASVGSSDWNYALAAFTKYASKHGGRNLTAQDCVCENCKITWPAGL